MAIYVGSYLVASVLLWCLPPAGDSLDHTLAVAAFCCVARSGLGCGAALMQDMLEDYSQLIL